RRCSQSSRKAKSISHLRLYLAHSDIGNCCVVLQSLIDSGVSVVPLKISLTASKKETTIPTALSSFRSRRLLFISSHICKRQVTQMFRLYRGVWIPMSLNE